MATTYNRATLSTFFQTGDVPAGSDYENLIYSQVNIVDTSAQAMAGSLQSTEFIASRISAGNGNFTGNLTVAGTISAASISLVDVTVSGLVATNILTTTLSATSVNTSTVSAATLYPVNPIIISPVTIAASGSTIGTANVLTAFNTRLTAVTDSTATGIALLANKAGLVQYLYNETTVSANLYPCVGGQINALASSAPFGLAGSTMYTIFHTKASGYAVK